MKLRLPKRRVWRVTIYIVCVLLVVAAIDLIAVQALRRVTHHLHRDPKRPARRRIHGAKSRVNPCLIREIPDALAHPNVIAFSLYGQSQVYLKGAIENVMGLARILPSSGKALR